MKAEPSERTLARYFPEAVRTAEQIRADEYRCVKCGAFVYRADRLWHAAAHVSGKA